MKRKINKSLISVVFSIILTLFCLFLIKEIIDYKYELNKDSLNIENIAFIERYNEYS